MFIKYHYLFCLIFTSLQVQYCQQSSAQTNNSGYLDKEYSINSEILNEERFYRIYLPYDYYENTTTYDVLYLLDGPRHFTYVSGIVEYLSRYVENVPPLIIVDIRQQNRSMDMTPTKVPDNENSGGAEKFSGFLSKELLPQIDASYRTTSQKTVFGYSLSGLFAMYCFFEKPDIFDSYITCSPSLWWDDQLLLKM